MSGLLTQVSNIASGISSGITSLQSLLGLSDSGLTLGPVTLTNFELPSQIVVPYAQAWVIHKLIGGARVFDDMGADPGSITWSGLLLGNYAPSRAKTLAALCTAAQPITLSWGNFSFQVVIDKFTPTIGYANIPYQIECHVVPPNPPPATATTAASTQTSITQELGNGLNAVSNAVTTVSNFASATAGTVQQALGTVSSLAGAVGIQIPALSKISQDVAGVQSIAASASGLAQGASTVGNILNSTTSIAGTIDKAVSSVGKTLDGVFTGTANAVLTATGAAGVTANLTQAAAQIGNSAVTLGGQAAIVQTPAQVLAARAGGAGTVTTVAPTPSFTVT
jgi:hypothetical protein